MALRKPESMDECVYFTQRSIGSGEVMVWVLRQNCPSCGKARMGKPRNSKGKVMTLAKEYVCEKCGHRIEKTSYEDSLVASVGYTCPQCGYGAETQVPFKRRYIDGVQTLRFQCGKCGANIDVKKKMKEK